MSRAIKAFLIGSVALFMAGCQTASKAIESASQKSLVGSGFMTINKITVTDTATNTYTPQLFSMFINGQYVSMLKNSNFMFYDRKESASTFNSSAVTTEETLVVQTDGKTSVAEVIKQLAELEKNRQTAENK